MNVAALHEVMNGYVERREVPGMVTLLARGEDVSVDVLGTMTAGGSTPMRRDTIFRIASISKPITAAAAMILVDDGILSLDDPIERWLPELSNRRVLKRIDSPLDDTVPAKRAITVRDVQTFCFGFGSVMARPGTCPIQEPIREGHLMGDGMPRPSLLPTMEEWIQRLGALPLMYQPGERWLYNTGSDVLAVLVARASGRSFGAFLRERLFEPLGMKDTAFSVPASELDRLPASYQLDQQTKTLAVFDGAGAASEFSRAPAFEWGSGGLVSTADDYLAFCRMLLAKGQAGRKRILSQASAQAMTRDQLTAGQRIGAEIFFGKRTSWGFGMAVDIQEENPWNVPGRFGWDGGYGTSAYSDPKNDFTGILLTQRLMDSPEPPAVSRDFWRLAYQAL
jgi:CubicO group peptidase (beta-lactamase class C family)